MAVLIIELVKLDPVELVVLTNDKLELTVEWLIELVEILVVTGFMIAVDSMGETVAVDTSVEVWGEVRLIVDAILVEESDVVLPELEIKDVEVVGSVVIVVVVDSATVWVVVVVITVLEILVEPSNVEPELTVEGPIEPVETVGVTGFMVVAILFVVNCTVLVVTKGLVVEVKLNA